MGKTVKGLVDVELMNADGSVLKRQGENLENRASVSALTTLHHASRVTHFVMDWSSRLHDKYIEVKVNKYNSCSL